MEHFLCFNTDVPIYELDIKTKGPLNVGNGIRLHLQVKVNGHGVSVYGNSGLWQVGMWLSDNHSNRRYYYRPQVGDEILHGLYRGNRVNYLPRCTATSLS